MSHFSKPNPASTYTERIEHANNNLAQLVKKQRILPVFRLLSFGLLILIAYIAIALQLGWAFLALVPVIGLYIRLGIYDNKIKQRIADTAHTIQINQNELNYLKGDFSPFDAGNGYVDVTHPYTHDLDVFGEHSLYRAINRTTTPGGSQTLANFLSQAFLYRDEIKDRQVTLSELASMVDFRQQCQLVFGDTKPDAKDLETLRLWLKTPSDSKWLLRLKPLLFALPLLTLVSIITGAMGLTSISFPAFGIAIQLTIVMRFGRKIMMEHQSIGSQYAILKKYAGFLELIQNTDFSSNWVKRQKTNLNSLDEQTPAIVLHKLASLLNWMDTNLNILVAMLLNGLFMFNLHLLLRISFWKRQYAAQIPKWFACMADFDAMLSLANFTYNHPNFTFPEVVADEFMLKAVALGHPLIPEQECVTNSIQISGTNQFCIITGANMSGKSTFLRTIGTNLVLAMTGAPVFASSFVFQPIAIASSIRTSDSLARHESYFYAELKRLKEILEELAKGAPLLILLDEILKGTNSYDKQNGSVALIKQLMKYKPIGLFATHDLELGNLRTAYPENIQNLCFEISIEDNKLFIDYKLRPGVCSTLNASYLMKQMGITEE